MRAKLPINLLIIRYYSVLLLSPCMYFRAIPTRKKDCLEQGYECAIKDLSKWIILKSRLIYDHFLCHVACMAHLASQKFNFLAGKIIFKKYFKRCPELEQIFF